MTWDECVAELCRARKMRFSGVFEYLTCSYEDLGTYEEYYKYTKHKKDLTDEHYQDYVKCKSKKKYDVQYKMRIFLANRITWLFPRMTPGFFLFYINDTNDFSEAEVNLFKCLCEFLPRYKKITGKERKINLFEYLDKDIWEVVPYSERMKILEAINELAEDKAKIKIYLRYNLLPSEEKYLREEGEEPLEDVLLNQVKIKLEHPQYYRLTWNMWQLIEIFRLDYDDLIKNFGEENLFNLEEDVSRLLTKYDHKSDGYIKTYLKEVQSTSEIIQEEMIKSSTTTDDVGLFQSILLEGLRGRRKNNTRRR
jgi:hypothetical protein